MLYGLKPGPMLFTTNPDFVWALIASMFVGNIILVIMNLPLIPLFALSLRVPYRYLYPAILLICIIGAYSISSNVYGVWVMLIFGVIGYFMKKYDISAGPLVIALVLGPMLEYNLYRALALSRGDVTTFFTRPISGTLLAIAAVMSVVVMFKTVRMRRSVVEEQDE
jgi:TctA family transporter